MQESMHIDKSYSTFKLKQNVKTTQCLRTYQANRIAPYGPIVVKKYER